MVKLRKSRGRKTKVVRKVRQSGKLSKSGKVRKNNKTRKVKIKNKRKRMKKLRKVKRGGDFVFSGDDSDEVGIEEEDLKAHERERLEYIVNDAIDTCNKKIKDAKTNTDKNLAVSECKMKINEAISEVEKEDETDDLVRKLNQYVKNTLLNPVKQ